jgi:hypothetical protein
VELPKNSVKCRLVNRHRRIEFEELMRYKEEQKLRSADALKRLNELSQEMGEVTCPLPAHQSEVGSPGSQGALVSLHTGPADKVDGLSHAQLESLQAASAAVNYPARTSPGSGHLCRKSCAPALRIPPHP